MGDKNPKKKEKKKKTADNIREYNVPASTDTPNKHK
jgi:hypothetical protein